MEKLSCVILAAGNSSRLKKDIPKQYINLSGKPIIVHSLERIDSVEQISEIIIVAHTDYFSFIRKLIFDFGITKTVILIEGGKTRQESVYNGIRKSNNKSIIIHEAARPFAKTEDFIKLINNNNANISYSIEIPFTVVKGKEEIIQIFDRNLMRNIQLPQKFDRDSLIAAHEKALSNNQQFTDDSTLLFDILKISTTLLDGNENNIKITYNADLIVAEEIYRYYILGAE